MDEQKQPAAIKPHRATADSISDLDQYVVAANLVHGSRGPPTPQMLLAGKDRLCYITTMSQTTLLDRFLDPVAECFTPDVAKRLVDLRLDAETQARIDELREKANQGQLSDEERADYEDIVEGMDFIAILKAKARTVLARHAS